VNKNSSLLTTLTRVLLILVVFAGLTSIAPPAQAAVDKIYFTTTDDWSVKRANSDGTGVETLHISAIGTPSGIVVDSDNGKVYFTDNHTGVATIQRMNLDGSNQEDIVTNNRAIAIALDRYAEKIYFTTTDGTGDDYSVKRANTDGTNVETLYVSITGTPRGIALDTRNGKVYFTDNHSSVEKIQRMNLDGSDLEDVMTGVRAVSIILDVDDGKMYYTTNDDWSVKRANTDGTNVETLHVSNTGTPRDITLDLNGGKVYFTDNHSTVETIWRMNLDGSALEAVLTGVPAVGIETDPSTPTAITLSSIIIGNPLPVSRWLLVLGIALGLSGLLVVAGRKRTIRRIS
jgi:DNA-binding beta-propeller fold protein YncE